MKIVLKPLDCDCGQRDASNQRTFSVPYLSEDELDSGSANGSRQKEFAKVTISSQETCQVILDAGEISDMGCQSLAVLDHSGHAWPVIGFNSLTSH